MSAPSLRRAGVAVIGVTLLAKGVGYVREAVVAAVFGTTSVVDLYLAAAAIPAVICTVIYYSVPNAFVPLFSGSHQMRRRARITASGLLVVMLGLSAAVWLWASPLSNLLVRGFPESARSESAHLLRIGAWAIVFATLEALGRSRLLAGKHFVRPGLAFLWQSAAMVTAVLVWPEHGARALVWGFVAGTGLAALWNLAARQAAVPDAVTPSPHSESASAMSASRWVMAVFLVDAIAQAFSLIDRHFGSYLPAGSIAALQYANQIAFIPFSVLGMGLSTAIFPYLSDAVAANDGARTEIVLDRAVRWSLLGVVPMAVGMIVFRQDVVTLLLERGAFNAASRQLTATALAAFSVGLVPSVLAALWSRVFYSSRQWRPILYGSLVGISAKAVCGWWWVQSAGVTGLAAATAVAHCVWVLPLFWILRTAIPTERFLAWGSYGVRVLLLAAVPAVLVWWLAHIVSPDGSLPVHAAAVARLSAGAAASILSLLLLGPRWQIGEAGTVLPWMVRALRSVGGDSHRGE